MHLASHSDSFGKTTKFREEADLLFLWGDSNNLIEGFVNNFFYPVFAALVTAAIITLIIALLKKRRLKKTLEAFLPPFHGNSSLIDFNINNIIQLCDELEIESKSVTHGYLRLSANQQLKLNEIRKRVEIIKNFDNERLSFLCMDSSPTVGSIESSIEKIDKKINEEGRILITNIKSFVLSLSIYDFF